MVAEEEDRIGVEDLCVGPQLLLEEDGGHRGHVLVREADVGCGRSPPRRVRSSRCRCVLRRRPRPTSVRRSSRRRSWDSRRPGRPFGGGSVTRPGSVTWRRAMLNSKSPPYSMICRVMSSVPAVNSLSGIGSPERIRSISPKSVRGEDAQVLAVLVVDALDALADDHLDPRHQLGVGALLAARPLPPPLPRHRTHEAARLHGPPFDRRFGSPVRRPRPPAPDTGIHPASRRRRSRCRRA